MERVAAAVVGAGHAGLSTSKLLSDRGVEHVVLERATVAARWRDERWDSFTLLTPNWATWLPGWTYQGADPHGFMGRDEIVAYFEGYACSFGANVREGAEVSVLEPARGGGYRLQVGDDELWAESVVVATGPFQTPRLPDWAASLPGDVTQVHSSRYRAAGQLPPGAVLVVGSGPSGQQIADDLRRAGRTVYLSVGRHRRVPRRYRGRDYYWWYELGGYYERTASDLPPGRPRGDGVAPVLTGYDGGHDLDLRQLRSQGVTLLGRAVGFDVGAVRFAPGLLESLAAGDRAYAEFVAWVEARLFKFEGLFGEAAQRRTFDDPPEPSDALDLVTAGVSCVVWATGFRPDFARWIRADVFDDAGFPRHTRGVTAAPGLYFMGLPWQHRLRSPFIRGAEEDARYLVTRIAGADGSAAARSTR